MSVPVNGDVAEIYAKAKPDSLRFREIALIDSGNHSTLDRGGASGRPSTNAREFHQSAVTARELDDATVELFYSRISQFPNAAKVFSRASGPTSSSPIRRL